MCKSLPPPLPLHAHSLLRSACAALSPAQAIVQYMQASNPGRPIPGDKVLGFATPSDVNDWLTLNPERVLGGVHFSEEGERPPSGLNTSNWNSRL